MTTPLTPAARTKTKALFPILEKDEKTGIVRFVPKADEQIVIQSSAELMHYDIPGSKYQSSFNFVLLHDYDGQPILLSIGTDKHLYICAQVNGAVGSWEAYDITPNSQFEALVCDASNSPDNRKILIAVSGRNTRDKSKTALYHVVVDNPVLSIDDKGTTVGSPFGSVAATNLEGSHYIYNPSVKESWQLVKFPVQVENIRSVVPANLPSLGPGYVVLFEDNTAGKAVSCLFRGEGVSKLIYLTGLQNPRKVAVCVNRRGLTDVLIAADNGIGYVDTKKMNDAPVILLKDIACSNLVASEFAVSDEETNVMVHAVSTHGELFVVRGVRGVTSGNRVIFPLEALPIPIRNDIRNITGKVNPLTKSYEIVYVTKDKDDLCHLVRDPDTGLWKEVNLHVKAGTSNKTTRTRAFLITVTLSNGKGMSVPAGYNVRLSSAPTIAYINDRCYNLTRRAQAISLNAFGQLQIAIPTPDSLAAEPISITFMADAKDEETYTIQPAQRVLHNLALFKTGSALKDAKTYDGRPLFSEDSKSKNKDNFDEAAEVFAKLPQMLNTVAGNDPVSGNDGQEITIAWQKDETSSSRTSSNWLSAAVDAVGEALGDAIEFMKKAFKGLIKIALKIAGPIIRFIIKIGAKVIRFVLKTVSTIATGLLSFLEGVFGIDLSWLKDFFTFRFQKVEATQKDLATIMNNGLELTARYFHRNEGILEQSLDGLGRIIEAYVARPYTSEQMNQGSSDGLGILDNPIISTLMKFNPLSWLLEAVAEEFGADFKIPTLNLKLGASILATLKQQFNLLVNFLQRSWQSFTAAIGQPDTIMQNLLDVFRDGFWTLFESLKAIIISLFSLLAKSFNAIIEFCRGTWEIPDLTDLWKDLTDLDFSVINFITYVAAQVLELLNFGGKSVFHGYDIASIFSNSDNKELPGLLPKKVQDDLEFYERDAVSFDDQLKASTAAQTRGLAFMAANPVQQPRFGLMANTTDLPINETVSERRDPAPVGARAVLALARSGRTLARAASVGIEGLMKMNSHSSQDQSQKSVGDDNLDSSMSVSSFEPAGTLKISESAMNISTASTAASDNMGLTSSTSSGSLASGTSFKTLAIGCNSIALGCKITEMFVLLNYYDEAGQKGENLTGCVVDTFAVLIGLILSTVGDSQPILAVSNIISNAGCFASACLAPKKEVPEITMMISTASATLSSGLFLAPSPPTQVIAWAGFGVDVVCSLSYCGWLCSNITIARDYNTTGGPPNTGVPPPKKIGKGGADKDGPESPDVSDEEPDEEEEKKERLVDEPSQEMSTEIQQLYEEMEFQRTHVYRFPIRGMDPLQDLITNNLTALKAIVQGQDWYTCGLMAIDIAYGLHKDHNDGSYHVGSVRQRFINLYRGPVEQGLIKVGDQTATIQQFEELLNKIQTLMDQILTKLETTRDHIHHNWQEV